MPKNKNLSIEDQIRANLDSVTKAKAGHDKKIAAAGVAVEKAADALISAKLNLKTAKAAAKGDALKFARLTKTLAVLTGNDSGSQRKRRDAGEAVTKRLNMTRDHLLTVDGNKAGVKSVYTAIGGRDGGGGARWGTLRDSVNTNGDRFGLKMGEDGLTVIIDSAFDNSANQTTIEAAVEAAVDPDGVAAVVEGDDTDDDSVAA